MKKSFYSVLEKALVGKKIKVWHNNKNNRFELHEFKDSVSLKGVIALFDWDRYDETWRIKVVFNEPNIVNGDKCWFDFGNLCDEIEFI